jgi:hypothetical protein
MEFQIIGEIRFVCTIASDRTIRELRRLNRRYGKAKWRKRSGVAKIRLSNGIIRLAELHWYEGHGKGKKELKIKKYLG